MPENEDLTPNERPELKAERRAMLVDLTAQYLAQGGTIKTVAQGEITERKPGMQRMIYGNAPDVFRGGVA